ncbi:MAG: hypothetical protein WAV23_02600 [Minisyncoccia bacterium]
MAKQILRKAKYSKSKSIEKKENAVLEILLNDSVISQITGGDDDFPNIDGYFHLLTDSREMSGLSLQVQVKPLLYTKNGKPFTTCKPTLLAHAHDSSTPVLLIGVDPNKNLAYWAYLSPEFINNYLAEKEQIPSHTISIYFIEKNKITQTEKNYPKEWKKICLHHRNESNDKIISKYLKDLGKGTPQERIAAERLATLEQLVFYRTNTGRFPLIDLAFSIANEIRQYGDTDSKSSYIKLLEKITYQETQKVIEALFIFLMDKEETIREQAKKVILSISKYNFHVLNSIGYGPQRILFDSLEQPLSLRDEKIENLVVVILGNLLEPDFEGTSNPDMRTITFHIGALQATPYLMKIRKDSINLLLEIIQHSSNFPNKIQALKSLSRVFHLPDHGFADSDAEDAFRSMLDEEAKYIIGKYKKIVLNPKGNPIDSFPVVYEVECQLALLKVWKRIIPGHEKLLQTLRSSKNDYSLYRLFVGEPHRLRIDADYNVVEKEREEKIKGNLESINEKNLDSWCKTLEKISIFKDNTEDWHFNIFRDFLARIGKSKPKLTDKFLQKIYKDKSDLYLFAGSFIFGLRISSLSLWDKYANQAKRDKSIELTIQLLQSFEMRKRDDLNIRKEDIALIVDISKAQNNFSFLDKENSRLQYQIGRCITYLYESNPKVFRKLLLEQMKSQPKFEKSFFDHIGTAVHFKWIELSDWTPEELKELADLAVEAQELDYNHEQVINGIGKVDFELMMSIYSRRLNREAQQPETRYIAFPYHFSTDIADLIKDHPKYPKVLKTWISKVNERRDLYAMDLGKLIHEIGGNALTQVLEELVASEKEINLKKVLSLFPLIETPNFDICFKIVAATDNKEIWNTVGGRMRSTGVLSGSPEDNIHGNALRALRNSLNEEMQKTKNKRVKKFCKKEIKHLDIDIARSDEDYVRRLREEKEEFEANKEE